MFVDNRTRFWHLHGHGNPDCSPAFDAGLAVHSTNRNFMTESARDFIERKYEEKGDQAAVLLQNVAHITTFFYSEPGFEPESFDCEPFRRFPGVKLFIYAARVGAETELTRTLGGKAEYCRRGRKVAGC